MKKYILIVSSLLCLAFTNSCSESDLDLESQSLDNIDKPLTEEKIQMLLSGAYFSMASTNGYGNDLMIFGDLLGDNLFVSTTNPSYLFTANKSYGPAQNQTDFSFYGLMYDVIIKCNSVINSTVANNANVERIKAEAKILRGYAYFTLVNYYSPSPTSGVNQEYGVPLVLGNYDSAIQPARATVAQVFEQIISDLTAGANSEALDMTTSKVTLSGTAARLLLSKVYLTRRAPGDAALALKFADQVINNSPPQFGSLDAKALTNPSLPFNATTNPYKYYTYFAAAADDDSENQPETIWEIDVNNLTNQITGIGSNVALPLYYHRTGDKKCLLFNQTFYNSFGAPPTTATQILNDDVRRGSSSAGLLISTGTPNTDSPKGYWTNKYPRATTQNGSSSTIPFLRNIKVLRFSEAILNRIEALHLLQQDALALTELNAFALTRKGKTYTGANMQNDILTERAKEFYGEGQRFLDLKRYNLPITKPSNCVSNCDVPAGDKLFVLPVSQPSLNTNANLKQYPGW